MGDGCLIREERSGHKLIFDTVGESVLGLGIGALTELKAGVAALRTVARQGGQA